MEADPRIRSELIDFLKHMTGRRIDLRLVGGILIRGRLALFSNGLILLAKAQAFLRRGVVVKLPSGVVNIKAVLSWGIPCSTAGS